MKILTCALPVLACLALLLTAGTQAAEALPRVLVIGDSISMAYVPGTTKPLGYFTWAQEYLKGQATLTHNDGNALSSEHTLENVDSYLKDTPHPDLITWNNGLHDLSTFDLASGRELGHIQATIPEYQKNLRAIGKKLLASGARVIFFTTTDIPPKEAHRRAADLAAYNDAARVVMRGLGIPVYDLGGFSQKNLRGYHLNADQQNNVHYGPEGSQRLAQFVAAAIRTELKSLPSAKWQDGKLLTAQK
jgi:acyl-CoA thioesterase-1